MQIHYRLSQVLVASILRNRICKGIWGQHEIPARGGAIIICNHQSFLDPVIVGACTPREISYMARASLFSHPFFGGLIRSYNAFPVKRGSADVWALKQAIRRLRDGKLLLVFPEATRTIDGRIASLQPGVFTIAQRAKVPLIPVAIEGLFDMWPRTYRWPQSGSCWIQFGKKVEFSELRNKDPKYLAREFRDVLRELHNNLRTHVGRTILSYNKIGDEPLDDAQTDEP